MNIYKSLYNPYEVVRMFEKELSNYTGAPYVVAVDNCTDALFLCCLYKKVKEVTIPAKTYLSVPQSIIQAGGRVIIEDIEWKGVYELKPYKIFDAAKRFTSGMYSGGMMCLSFHDKKILKIGKGGAILTDDREAYEWFKKTRYEGRDEKLYHDDDITEFGYNMYMTPEQAARGLTLMRNILLHNEDLTEGYKDLREYSIFKKKWITCLI